VYITLSLSRAHAGIFMLGQRRATEHPALRSAAYKTVPIKAVLIYLSKQIAEPCRISGFSQMKIETGRLQALAFVLLAISCQRIKHCLSGLWKRSKTASQFIAIHVGQADVQNKHLRRVDLAGLTAGRNRRFHAQHQRHVDLPCCSGYVLS
jgi:hypothetical protein